MRENICIDQTEQWRFEVAKEMFIVNLSNALQRRPGLRDDEIGRMMAGAVLAADSFVKLIKGQPQDVEQNVQEKI